MAVQAIDPVALLTDVDDHLTFAERILAETDLPAAAADPIRRQVQRVRQRRDDPCLYLAVVGEFSAGKSTFIDAVLRDPLLKRAPLVTTAAATQLRYGPRLDLEVRFAGTRTWLSYGESPDRIVEWVEDLSSQHLGAATLRQLVDLVTSDERVARSVEGVRITYPAPLLEGGVVIVDTPGPTTSVPRATGSIALLPSGAGPPGMVSALTPSSRNSS